MEIKTSAVMAVTACALIMSTGCIKQEEFDAKVAAMTKEKETAVAELQVQVDNLNKDKETLSKKIGDQENDIVVARASLDEYRSKKDAAEAQLSSLKSDVSRYKSDMEAAQSTAKRLRGQIDGIESRCDEAEARAEDVEMKYNKLRAALLHRQQVEAEQYQMKAAAINAASANDVLKDAGLASMVEPEAATKVSAGSATEDADAIRSMLQEMENM